LLPDFTKRCFVAKSISNVFPFGMTSTAELSTETFPSTIADVESWQDKMMGQSPETGGAQETHASTIRFPVGRVPEYVAPH
jgi:hypothetical protein